MTTEELFFVSKTFMSKLWLMFEAVLFDNDGILIDTERRYVQACQEITQEMFGLEITLEIYQEWGYTKGTGTQGWLLAQGIENEKVEKYRTLRDVRYEELLSQPIEVMDGVKELLEFLGSQKIPRAMVTATFRKHLDLAHSQTGLLPMFTFAVTNEDTENSKPAPDGYLLAAKKLGIAPEKCLVLEDSPRGIAAGKAAGMTVWAIPSEQTRNLDVSMADERFLNLQTVIHKIASF